MMVRVTIQVEGHDWREGPVDVPLEQAPDGSLVGEYLKLGDVLMQVVACDPPERPEIERCGEVCLTVVVVANLPEVYAQSTVCFELPPTAQGEPASEEGHRIYPEDWRQVEWVGSKWAAETTLELQDILAIYTSARLGSGFTRVHVRQRIPRPLPAGIGSAADLAERFRLRRGRAGLRIEDRGVVEHGFSFTTAGGLVLYGCEIEGRLETLCLEFGERGPGLGQDLEILSGWAESHSLQLFDWCAARSVAPGPALEEYANRGGRYLPRAFLEAGREAGG